MHVSLLTQSFSLTHTRAGDGIPDIAVGGLGFPDGSSKGAVFIFFLTADQEIKDAAVITENVRERVAVHSVFVVAMVARERMGRDVMGGETVTQCLVCPEG